MLDRHLGPLLSDLKDVGAETKRQMELSKTRVTENMPGDM
jgi:hypothetical protein